jgi:hypothetical protein
MTISGHHGLAIKRANLLAYHAISFCLGLLFVLTGLIHYRNPYYFFRSIDAYQLATWYVAFGFAAVAPYSHVLIGCALIMNVCRLGALATSTALLILYAIVNIWALLKGLNINCGCFGEIYLPVSWTHVAILMVCILGSSYAFRVHPIQRTMR